MMATDGEEKRERKARASILERLLGRAAFAAYNNID
jgi:hypothetical protein